MQKHLHIIESNAWILWIFVINFLLPMNFWNSFEICLKYSVYILQCKYKAIQWDPTDIYSPRFITYALFFILVKLFLDKTTLNLDSFTYYFCISKLVKIRGGIENHVLFLLRLYLLIDFLIKWLLTYLIT